ncbi:MAG: alpha/beta hydrolase family protein [Planctomycetota bacterium]|jgi:dienelactone hydrolase
MTSTQRLTAATFVLLIGANTWPAVAQSSPGTWPLGRLKSEVPNFRVVDDAGPIHSILYEGEPVHGQTTEVFAFYASPRTLKLPDAPARAPAVVLIHGGGGTAFSDWVWMWARRGYAAIAMDLSGRRPPAPSFDADGQKIPDFNHDRNQRTKLERAGVDHGRPEKFDSIGGAVDDDWPYHAVASVMRAHTLIRSFPDVDPDRTAVTGISWGGYTTCMVASLDNRFKAAVPVYGCGFLHEGESVQKPAIDNLGERRDDWVRAYDPSSHLARCATPTLWVNGTHDNHYVLDSYAKSYALARGPKTFRIEPRMRHSHGAGWQPKEIGLFIDSILIGGVPLPIVGPMNVSPEGQVTTPIVSQTKITKATLHYTTETGLRSEREWQSLTATITDGRATATGLPDDANTWLMTVTDERDAMVSTEVGFR